MQQAAAFIPRGWHVLPKQENNAIQRETENVGTALLSNLTQLRILDVALLEGFSIRLLSARAALYARPRPKMAREARAQLWFHELIARKISIDRGSAYDHH